MTLFYLCIRKILFVAQIIPPCGTFICAQIIIYEYMDAKKIAFLPPDNREKSHVGVNVERFFIT